MLRKIIRNKIREMGCVKKFSKALSILFVLVSFRDTISSQSLDKCLVSKSILSLGYTS